MSGEAVRQASEIVPDKHSLWSYITGGVTALWGALTLQEWAALIGILATMGTFAYNIYDKRKRREAELAALEAAKAADRAKAQHFHSRSTDHDT